jgi:hypothetical protein
MDKSKFIDCFRTYAFYERGKRKPRRLAIFGKFIPQAGVVHLIEITVIPCSTKDAFDKDKAQELYWKTQNIDKLPEGEKIPTCEVYMILVPIHNKAKKVFLEHCIRKYLRKLIVRNKIYQESVKYI